MSYQVLARKWRPRDFNELVGQQQTAQALMNALESQRLHHAYLFTGTRGVGKTTIARILSKSLNCEQGITSNPCGLCSSCIEISQGNFVDLLEIDAASKTKVEDTRELLDNVQYRPTRGRYKVYLIDEVHMLSGHSFNALLKTLEEPPPHVVFLLATTDPQKMPVTVLSRCLQFHLRRMDENEIINHLTFILDKESITCENGSLDPIAKGADGSMRDALSLLDQAIAYCGNEIKKQTVMDMLGILDREYSYQLLTAVCSGDVTNLMALIGKIAELSPDYDELLSDWLSLLHQVAVCQATGTFTDERIALQANSVSVADIQLFYQLSLHARRDLAFVPHPRQGFEMAMLRIMAFKPKTVSDLSNSSASKERESTRVSEKKKREQSVNSVRIATNNKTQTAESGVASLNLTREMSAHSDVVEKTKVAKISMPKAVLPKTAALNEVLVSNENEKIPVSRLVAENWFDVVSQMQIEGNGLQILLNATAQYREGKVFIDYLSKVSPLLTANATRSIIDNVRHYFNKSDLKVEFSSVAGISETPRERQKKLHELAIDNAERELASDPQVAYLVEKLDAMIPRESISIVKQTD